MKRRNKLALLKKLAVYAARTPVQARLDRLWGFKPEPRVSKKNRSKTGPKSLEGSSNEKTRVEQAFSSLEASKEPEENVATSKDVYESSKESVSHRKPWELDPVTQEEKRMFKDTVKELRTLVYPHLDPIAKRQYDNAKLTALGGKVAHNRKMPYNEFLQRSRALKRNVQKNMELEKQLGVKLFMDTKGGARFVELEKRKRKKEFKNSKAPFDFGGKDGIYHVKPKRTK